MISNLKEYNNLQHKMVQNVFWNLSQQKSNALCSKLSNVRLLRIHQQFRVVPIIIHMCIYYIWTYQHRGIHMHTCIHIHTHAHVHAHNTHTHTSHNKCLVLCVTYKNTSSMSFSKYLHKNLNKYASVVKDCCYHVIQLHNDLAQVNDMIRTSIRVASCIFNNDAMTKKNSLKWGQKSFCKSLANCTTKLYE